MRATPEHLGGINILFWLEPTLLAPFIHPDSEERETDHAAHQRARKQYEQYKYPVAYGIGATEKHQKHDHTEEQAGQESHGSRQNSTHRRDQDVLSQSHRTILFQADKRNKERGSTFVALRPLRPLRLNT